jgi:hypothetical protein
VDRKLSNVDRRLLQALSDAERGLGQVFVRKSDTKTSNAQLARNHLSRCIAEIEAARRVLRSLTRASRG